MATVNTQVYNDGTTGAAGVYNPGDAISLAVNYTPDTPSVVAAPFTATTTITNSGGTVTATSSSSFVVNQTQENGDTAAESDTGSRAWAAGTPAPGAPDGNGAATVDVTFTTTA